VTPRASLVCGAPGCPNLAPCSTHVVPTHRWGTGARDRTETAAWKRLRLIVLRRARRRCAKCGGPASIADHVVPKAFGGTDHLSNLQALCDPCHRAKTTKEGAQGARLKRKGNARDGWTATESEPAPHERDATDDRASG